MICNNSILQQQIFYEVKKKESKHIGREADSSPSVLGKISN
jgi:hypothetical protein